MHLGAPPGGHEGQAWRLSATLPLVVLLAVTGVHLVLRQGAGLSPWKGGGFAMFSTVDSPGTRTIRVSVLTAGAEVTALVPAALDEAVGELRAVASVDRAHRLAVELARRSWAVGPDGRALPTGAGAGPPRLDVRAVRVEVLRTGYDAAQGAVVLLPMLAATATAGG